jgi:hypothetical protein
VGAIKAKARKSQTLFQRVLQRGSRLLRRRMHKSMALPSNLAAAA